MSGVQEFWSAGLGGGVGSLAYHLLWSLYWGLSQVPWICTRDPEDNPPGRSVRGVMYEVLTNVSCWRVERSSLGSSPVVAVSASPGQKNGLAHGRDEIPGVLRGPPKVRRRFYVSQQVSQSKSIGFDLNAFTSEPCRDPPAIHNGTGAIAFTESPDLVHGRS